MTWIRQLWYRRLRRIDMEVLWPSCRRLAKDIDQARAAFACHAMHDPAWLSLGEDEVKAFIDELT